MASSNGPAAWPEPAARIDTKQNVMMHRSFELNGKNVSEPINNPVMTRNAGSIGGDVDDRIILNASTLKKNLAVKIVSLPSSTRASNTIPSENTGSNLQAYFQSNNENGGKAPPTFLFQANNLRNKKVEARNNIIGLQVLSTPISAPINYASPSENTKNNNGKDNNMRTRRSEASEPFQGRLESYFEGPKEVVTEKGENTRLKKSELEPKPHMYETNFDAREVVVQEMDKMHQQTRVKKPDMESVMLMNQSSLVDPVDLPNVIEGNYQETHVKKTDLAPVMLMNQSSLHEPVQVPGILESNLGAHTHIKRNEVKSIMLMNSGSYVQPIKLPDRTITHDNVSQAKRKAQQQGMVVPLLNTNNNNKHVIVNRPHDSMEQTHVKKTDMKPFVMLQESSKMVQREEQARIAEPTYVLKKMEGHSTMLMNESSVVKPRDVPDRFQNGYEQTHVKKTDMEPVMLMNKITDMKPRDVPDRFQNGYEQTYVKKNDIGPVMLINKSTDMKPREVLDRFENGYEQTHIKKTDMEPIMLMNKSTDMKPRDVQDRFTNSYEQTHIKKTDMEPFMMMNESSLIKPKEIPERFIQSMEKSLVRKAQLVPRADMMHPVGGTNSRSEVNIERFVDETTTTRVKRSDAPDALNSHVAVNKSMPVEGAWTDGMQQPTRSLASYEDVSIQDSPKLEWGDMHVSAPPLDIHDSSILSRNSKIARDAMPSVSYNGVITDEKRARDHIDAASAARVVNPIPNRAEKQTRPIDWHNERSMPVKSIPALPETSFLLGNSVQQLPRRDYMSSTERLEYVTKEQKGHLDTNLQHIFTGQISNNATRLVKAKDQAGHNIDSQYYSSAEVFQNQPSVPLEAEARLQRSATTKQRESTRGVCNESRESEANRHVPSGAVDMVQKLLHTETKSLMPLHTRVEKEKYTPLDAIESKPMSVAEWQTMVDVTKTQTRPNPTRLNEIQESSPVAIKSLDDNITMNMKPIMDQKAYKDLIPNNSRDMSGYTRSYLGDEHPSAVPFVNIDALRPSIEVENTLYRTCVNEDHKKSATEKTARDIVSQGTVNTESWTRGGQDTRAAYKVPVKHFMKNGSIAQQS
jgi:hypothetical protein